MRQREECGILLKAEDLRLMKRPRADMRRNGPCLRLAVNGSSVYCYPFIARWSTAVQMLTIHG